VYSTFTNTIARCASFFSTYEVTNSFADLEVDALLLLVLVALLAVFVDLLAVLVLLPL
jgi:hypothetical protein